MIPASLLWMADAAVRTLVLAAILAGALAICRVRRPEQRLRAWTTFLFAALTMPVLMVLVPRIVPRIVPGIRIPLLRPIAASNLTIVPSQPAAVSEYVANPIQYPTQQSRPATQGLAHQHVPGGSPRLATGIYLAVALFLALRLIVGMFYGWRLGASAEPLDDIGGVLVSELIQVPLTVGILHPVILLPANWREWPASTLQSVLAHERAHIERRDTLTQLLARVYRALFWFSPLGWWLAINLEELAEQASDDAALTAGIDPRDYAAALYRFFGALTRSPERVWWRGVAMAHRDNSLGRINRVLGWRRRVSMKETRMGRAAASLAATVALAVLLLGAAAHPVHRHAQQEAARVPTLASAQRPAPPAALASLHENDTHGSYLSHVGGPNKSPQGAPETARLAAPSQPERSQQQDALPVKPAEPQAADKYEGRRLLVLYFDWARTQPEDARNAVESAESFVQKQLQPDDLVAILWLGNAVEVDQEFTADKSALLHHLDELRAGAESVGGPTWITRPSGPRLGSAGSSDGASGSNIANVGHGLGGIQTVCNMLASIQQKKALLYFSSGIQRSGADDEIAVRAAVNSCFKANVAVYTIDARALQAARPGSQATQQAPLQSASAATQILEQGDQLKAAGDLPGAIAQYKRALQQSPNSSLGHYRLAEAYFQQPNWQRAAEEYEQAMTGDLDPKWVEVWGHMQMGKIFDATGQRLRAVNEYQKAIDTHDDSMGAQGVARQLLTSPYKPGTQE